MKASPRRANVSNGTPLVSGMGVWSSIADSLMFYGGDGGLPDVDPDPNPRTCASGESPPPQHDS